MTRTGRLFAVCQRPLTQLLLSHHPHPALARSIGLNGIGYEGASALAAILKETQITNLRCAAARVFAFVSMPIDTIPPSLLTVWPTTCSAASTSVDKGPTPQTASPSCARVSREAP